MTSELTLLQKLGRSWRRIASGISFSLFGLGGLVLAVTVFPLLNIFIRDVSRREVYAQRTVHKIWTAFVWVVTALGVIEVEFSGAELLAEDTGTLVIANHPSLIDVVLIMSLMNRTQCVVKPGVWSNPFMRGVVRATNYIPNLGDPERLIHDCVGVLRAGNNLVMFPEGSRTVPGEKPRLQRGFANIAVRASSPVRLVSISCSPPTLFKGEKWYQVPTRRPRFHVRVWERLDMQEFQTSGVPTREARELSAYVARRFEELQAHA